jgi:hypothetical protein
MKTKNFSSFMVTISIILPVLALLSVIFYLSSPKPIVKAENNASTQIEVSTGTPTHQNSQAMNSDTLSQTIGDITVEITYAKIIPSGVEIGLCYATPDGGDWYPGPGALQINSQNILPDEAGFTSEIAADGTNMGKRCGFIRYRVENLTNSDASLNFVLKDIHAIPREMPACQNLQQRIDTNPKAVKLGLKISCDDDGEQIISTKIIAYDSSFTSNEAQTELNMILLGSVNGPWEFSINTYQ